VIVYAHQGSDAYGIRRGVVFASQLAKQKEFELALSRFGASIGEVISSIEDFALHKAAAAAAVPVPAAVEVAGDDAAAAAAAAEAQ
jgi:hypothetical protein